MWAGECEFWAFFKVLSFYECLVKLCEYRINASEKLIGTKNELIRKAAVLVEFQKRIKNEHSQ